jgi:hypothetical protein
MTSNKTIEDLIAEEQEHEDRVDLVIYKIVENWDRDQGITLSATELDLLMESRYGSDIVSRYNWVIGDYSDTSN